MDKLFKKLLDHHKLVCVVFIILALVSTVIQGAVKVNTDFSSFLPESAPSTVGLHTMNEVFDQALPNVRMQVSDLGIGAALDLARELVDVPGVSSIMWLGSMADVRQPLETLDEGLLTAWTAEDGFLFSLAIAEGDDVEDTIAALRGLAEGSGGGAVYMDGQALANLQTRGSIGSELILVMGFAILLLLLVLSSTSDSWLEPLVFLVVIGAAILINLGTNIFKGEISMVTQMAASVLQLAVSIDYGIVLLHAYRHRKAEGLSPYDAMYAALKHAFPILLSSAAVTFFGFLSLVFMVLALGMDMGIVLSKGILISFICVSFFMPCLILWCQKPLERTRHRILLKRFGGFARVCSQLAIPATILVVLLAVPSFLGEKNLDFMYGSTNVNAGVTQLDKDQAQLERLYETSNQWVLMVPWHQWADEQNLVAELEALPGVSSVTSAVNTIGVSIPEEVVPETALSQLMHGGFSRIIITTPLPGEGQETFALVEQVRAAAASYYGSEFFVAGSADVFYDLAETSTQDITNVVLFSMVAIMLVLLVMYRSLSLPVLLTGLIMIATWINLSIPYFLGTQISYIGYLIISAVQLGATVDYAIIMASDYLENRRTLPPKESARLALESAAIPILTSGTILAASGFLLYWGSGDALISALGLLLGRGALISVAVVFLALPLVLRVCDTVIQKTTWKMRLFKAPKLGATTAGMSEKSGNVPRSEGEG